MNMIFKYTINSKLLDHDAEINTMLPAGAKVLSIQAQGNEVAFWCMVSNGAGLVKTTILVAGTGMQLADNIDAANYLGTVQLNGYVWHFFKKV